MFENHRSKVAIPKTADTRVTKEAFKILNFQVWSQNL